MMHPLPREMWGTLTPKSLPHYTQWGSGKFGTMGTLGSLLPLSLLSYLVALISMIFLRINLS